MYDIGRVCMKLAGRDAGGYCVVVDKKDEKLLIDGQTRRRLVNPNHLEATKKTADVKQGASHEDVVKALAKIDIAVTTKINKYNKKKKE